MRHAGATIFAVIAVALGLVAAACSSSGGSGDPLGEPEFEVPPAESNSLVFVEGSDRDQPAAAIVVAEPDGAIRHRIKVGDRLVRVRETASPTHAVVLSRVSGAATTRVAILDVVTGDLAPLELPRGDWEVVPLVGTPRISPGELAVLAEATKRWIAVVDLRSQEANVMVDVPDAGVQVGSDRPPPALRIGPTGEVAVLTMVDGGRVIGIEGGSRRLSGAEDGFTFVRWLGNGRAVEYVRTTPGAEPVLSAELVAGGEPKQVRVGQVDAALPTPRGVVMVRDRGLWLIERAGPRKLVTGKGPFVLPVTVDGSGSHLLVFDGAGGGFENTVVDTSDGKTRSVDLPGGTSPVPGTVGGNVVWLASGDGAGPVVSLDLARATAKEVFRPPPDQPVNPTLLHTSIDGRHAVARVGSSSTALALRAVLLRAEGGEPVELAQGRDANGRFSPDGRYVAVTWDPVKDPVDRRARLAVYDTTTGERTDLGPAHEAVWVGA